MAGPVERPPSRRPGQSFEDHQRETAEWLGYGQDVEAMNRDHDPLHRAVCKLLGVKSYSLNSPAIPFEHAASALEEDAVLAVQRFARFVGGRIPK